MSASERLKELSVSRAIDWPAPSYEAYRMAEDAERLRKNAIERALPELIAVVEAAENAEDYMVAVRKNELETFLQVPLSQWLPVVTAVAALDEALSTKGER